jgi:N6-L-threonylcarbamoyladenine synthase
VENLLKKAFRATLQSGTRRLVLAGGVAANRRLRERAEERGRRERVQVFLPSKLYCTDNAAMIARAGWIRLSRGERSGLDLGCTPTWPLSRAGAA